MEIYWIIVATSLAAVNCSLVGTYLVLRKLVMMGDAISHAILPGIVVACLWSGTRQPWIVTIGASSVGILTVFLVSYLHRHVNLKTDAAIGINFTWLFALGVILISLFSGKVDLDPECILYGEVAYVPLDEWISFCDVSIGPRSVYVLAVLLLINLTVILLGYKELGVTTFDPAFAKSIGISTTVWHYVLMGITSLVTVTTFEIMGAILVVSLLVAPPAAAYLCTKRLHAMLMVSCCIGCLASLGGYLLASWTNGSIAGAVSTIAGLCFMCILGIQLGHAKRKSRSCNVIHSSTTK